MKLEDIHQIAVLGSGIMGHGIAQGFLMGGYNVRLFDISADALDTARAHITENLVLFADAGMLKDGVSGNLGRLATTTALSDAVSDAQFIMEVIPEILDLKQRTFAEVEGLCSAGAIMASNTSHLPLSRLFDRVKDRSRTVGAHYFNPPQIVPCVEIIKAEGTSDATFQTTYDLMARIGKEPVRVNLDIPGFIVNRVQTAVMREAADLIARGVAGAEDIDKAVRSSMGFRSASIGPLRMADLGGVDAWEDCCAQLLPDMARDTEAPALFKDLVAKGHTGIRAGRGFYTYDRDFQQSELDETIKTRDKEFLNRLKNLYWKNRP